MISSFAEKILFLIFVYCSAILLRFTIFVPNMPPQLSGMVVVILAYIIYLIYVRVRNRYVSNKIWSYLRSNDYISCCNYINKCLSKQPELFWMKFENALYLAMHGEVSDFNSYVSELSKDKKMSKCKSKYMIDEFQALFAYLTRERNIDLTIDYSKVDFLKKTLKMVELYQNSDNNVLGFAFEVYNMPYNLCKCIAAMIISLEYRAIQDDYNSELFYDKAIKYAPSDEVLYCVKRIYKNNRGSAE